MVVYQLALYPNRIEMHRLNILYKLVYLLEGFLEGLHHLAQVAP